MLRRLQESGETKDSVSESLTLASAPSGQFRCVHVNADGIDARRLKRMGFCEGLVVEVMGTGDPMIVLASHSKLGLSRFLARKIEVVPADVVTDTKSSTDSSPPAAGAVG